jgi:hypothetical protein
VFVQAAMRLYNNPPVNIRLCIWLILYWLVVDKIQEEDWFHKWSEHMHCYFKWQGLS